MSRVVVFVDAQNFYRSARRAFFDDAVDPYRLGQFHPRALGGLLCSRDSGRSLTAVRLYTGRPDAYLQPAAYRANVRQCEAWEEAGCYVFARQLRYPHGWPDNPSGQGPQEKGIDVRMALDIALLAHQGEYDVAIVCSGDTDLFPAVEEGPSGALSASASSDSGRWAGSGSSVVVVSTPGSEQAHAATGQASWGSAASRFVSQAAPGPVPVRI